MYHIVIRLEMKFDKIAVSRYTREKYVWH